MSGETEQQFETQEHLDSTRPAKGRPTDYTKELADKICEELALGKSMRTVCKMADMPAMSTVFKWLRENKEFSEQYARAKQESADAMAEEILDIADTTEEGETITEKIEGTEVKRGDMLGHRKLKIETRKWLMAKMKPKKYGEKLDLTSGDEPIKQAESTAEIMATVREIIALGKNDNSSNQNPVDASAGK
jgi:hypothetical protein